MLTAVLVAVIAGAFSIVVALISNGRHTKEIRRQLTPASDKTMAELVAEHQRDLASIAVAFGLHDRDDLRHRAPIRERKLP